MIFHLACLFVFATTTAPAAAQDTITRPRVWRMVWQDVSSSDGRTTRVPVFVWNERPPERGRISVPVEISAVARVDERLRVARAARDVTQLTALVSEDFYGTDARGNRIDRQQFLSATVGSTIQAIGPRTSEFRLAAGAVIVTGEEEMSSANGHERIFFTRIYSRDPQDQEWHLISSAETHATA